MLVEKQARHRQIAGPGFAAAQRVEPRFEGRIVPSQVSQLNQQRFRRPGVVRRQREI